MRKVDFDLNIETPTPATSPDPLVDTDFATKGFADNNYTQGGASVTDLNGLRAVSEDNRKNGDLRYVQSINAIFSFDSSATGADDNLALIEPDDGSGRWIRTPSMADSEGTPEGVISTYFGLAAPNGWLICNGDTIGSSSSGATALASDLAIPLFLHLWENSDPLVLVMQDSSGSPTVRGDTALDDFNADKRMPLPDLRGEFIRGLDAGRGVDSGRTLGSAQSTQLGQHNHAVSLTTGSTGVPHTHSNPSVNDNAAPNFTRNLSPAPGATGWMTSGPTAQGTLLAQSHGHGTPTNVGTVPSPSTSHNHPVSGNTANTGGTPNSNENRPRNVAMNYIIKV